MRSWKKIAPEVFTATTSIVSINAHDVFALKEAMANCDNHRARICAHLSINDSLHEMIIAMTEHSYIRPHKHHNKSESFHIIEGFMDVVIFNDTGDVIKVVPMGDARSGKCMFYRLSEPYFHTLVLRSECVVFHETTNGPFCRDATEYAPWSPPEEAAEDINVFLQQLDTQLIENTW